MLDVLSPTLFPSDHFLSKSAAAIRVIVLQPLCAGKLHNMLSVSFIVTGQKRSRVAAEAFRIH